MQSPSLIAPPSGAAARLRHAVLALLLEHRAATTGQLAAELTDPRGLGSECLRRTLRALRAQGLLVSGPAAPARGSTSPVAWQLAPAGFRAAADGTDRALDEAPPLLAGGHLADQLQRTQVRLVRAGEGWEWLAVGDERAWPMLRTWAIHRHIRLGTASRLSSTSQPERPLRMPFLVLRGEQPVVGQRRILDIRLVVTVPAAHGLARQLALFPGLLNLPVLNLELAAADPRRIARAISKLQDHALKLRKGELPAVAPVDAVAPFAALRRAKKGRGGDEIEPASARPARPVGAGTPWQELLGPLPTVLPTPEPRRRRRVRR